MEALALLCFVIARLVMLLLQFVSPVGERARVREFTDAVQLPEFANLGLEFRPKAALFTRTILLC